MLRLVIGTGVLLMAVGFGAAGWQYWQSLPAADPVDPVASAAAGAATAGQSWLISPTGGLIPAGEVQAYLAQAAFVPDRSVQVRRQAMLADLLAEGEKLPEPAFLQVLADIRAPKVAVGLCQVLQDALAGACAVQSARVVPGSVDPVLGTALFEITLVYRLKDDGAELPDLAAHVLRSDEVQVDIPPTDPASASPESALQATLAAVAEACAAEGVGDVCRPMRLAVDWVPGQAVAARARIAWLDPLPDGMFVAPPLQSASDG